MDLSFDQKRIVKTAAPHVVVWACASAGKTQTMSERVRYLIEQGEEKNKIVVITFTNAAAEQMKRRIGEQSNGVFIGTVHSYASYLLKTIGIDGVSLIEEENFDLLLELCLKNQNCRPPIEHLIVDEAQDTTKTQFEFFDFLQPNNWMYFMDLRQSIYGFAGADPEHFIPILENPRTTVFELKENYRNGPNILKFAKKIISGSAIGDYALIDNSICMREDIKDKVYESTYSLTEIEKIVKNIPSSLYGSWFILTRSNAQLEEILNFVKAKGYPCDTFKKGDLTYEEFQRRMDENTIKVLTVHSAKGLEADNVIVVGLPKWAYDPEARRLSYVAATRARDSLIWMKKPTTRKKKRSFSFENSFGE